MFTYVHDNKGEVPAIEEFTVGSSAVALGEPLKLDSGNLVNVGGSGTTKPTFIAQAAAAANEVCPVVRVTPAQHWRTQLNAAFTPTVGAKYTTGGDKKDKLTSTTSSGIAEVVKTFGSASGDDVIVCFS